MVGVVSAGVFSGLVYGFEKPIKTAARTDQDAADAEPRRITINTGSMEASLVGIASMYNPYRRGHVSGGERTASGEFYDPAAWAAAIQIDLRELFGGVHYGRRYQPSYALVECCHKRAIVKINDVGPLKPGRVIDLGQRSMRYFDPSLRAGLIHDMKITLLSGGDWTPGPVETEQPVVVAAAQLPAEDPAPGPDRGGQPVDIADEKLSRQEPTPEPVESEQPVSVAAMQMPVEERAPEPVVSEQPASVVAENLPSEEITPEPADSRQAESVAAAQPQPPNPSHGAEIVVAYVMTGIVGFIIAPPAGDAESSCRQAATPAQEQEQERE